MRTRSALKSKDEFGETLEHLLLRRQLRPRADKPAARLSVQILDETHEPQKTLLKRLVIILVAYKGLSMLVRHYLKT